MGPYNEIVNNHSAIETMRVLLSYLRPHRGLSLLAAGLTLCMLTQPASSQLQDRASLWWPDVGGESAAHAVAVQPDGKVLVVGHVLLSRKQQFLVARFTSDGAIDRTFHAGYARRLSDAPVESVPGIVAVEFGRSASASAVVIRPDGRIVVGGTFDAMPSRHIGFVGLRADGSLDRSFGKNGITVVAAHGDLALAGLVLEPGGSILFAGTDLASNTPIVGRLDSAGWHDDRFGDHGTVHLRDLASHTEAVARQADGTIILGLSPTRRFSAVESGVAIVALNSNGEQVENFGERGVARIAGLQNAFVLTDLRVQPDDRIVVVGSETSGKHRYVVAARLTVDGELDRSFRGGISTVDRISAPDPRAARILLQVTPEGHSLIATSVMENGRYQIVAVRLIAGDGELDPWFGRAGVLMIDAGISSILTDLAQSTSGNIAMVGHDEAGGRMFVMGFGDESYILHDAISQDVRLPQSRTSIAVGPNPTASWANVELILPEDTKPCLDIFDTTGRRVAVIFNEPMSAGRHVLRIDFQQYPAGVYIVRLRTDTQTITRTITVL